MKIPERKPPVTRMQPNRVFADEKEMREYVENNFMGATIKVFWPVRMLACEIEIPVKNTCIKK